MMKETRFTLVGRSLLTIVLAVILWTNRHDIPNWLIAVVCLSYLLEGVNGLLKARRMPSNV